MRCIITFVAPITRKGAAPLTWDRKPDNTGAALRDLNTNPRTAEGGGIRVAAWALGDGGTVGSADPGASAYTCIIVGAIGLRYVHFSAPSSGDTVHFKCIPGRPNIHHVLKGDGGLHVKLLSDGRIFEPLQNAWGVPLCIRAGYGKHVYFSLERLTLSKVVASHRLVFACAVITQAA